ncbi:type II secretion system F family protein [Nocardiopsis protaetiae]|uniref:type II secretion system F family protein n=1 Tax=Nocardiopsis protaetiae TaxID=3382270 RepID=UPI00387B2386
MTSMPVAALGGAAVGVGLVLLAPTLTTVLPALRARLCLTRSAGVRIVAALGAGSITWALTSWPVAALLAALALWWLPRHLAPDRTATTEASRIEAVAAWAEQLRDLISASAGLHQAIRASARTAPAPIREDVCVLVDDLTAGQDLDRGLVKFAHRVDNETADLVVAALTMAAQRHSADLVALLGTLAEAARDRAAMLVRIHASRARTRTSVRIITATSLAMAAGMAVLNGPFFAPLGSAGGQAVLALVGVLWAVALWWLSRLAEPPHTERLLIAAEGIR